jgi:transposase
MTLGGMGPALTVEGATTSAVFETYVEQVLEPTLRKGQVVVMDNLSAHKGERVKELIEGRGCELIYLPSYSPDFNPIEEAFSKIKDFLRKSEARTREALVEAIGAAISAVSPLRTRAASLSTVGVRYVGSIIMVNAVGPPNGDRLLRASVTYTKRKDVGAEVTLPARREQHLIAQRK